MTDDPPKEPVPAPKVAAGPGGGLPSSDASAKDDRQERLARALRDNLRRRKEQERARGSGDGRS